MSETGIATTGTSTERSDPRNRKITIMTMSSVSIRVLNDLVDRVVDVLGGVVGDARLHAGRQLLLNRAPSRSRTRFMTSSEFALGKHPHAHEHRAACRRTHFGVVVLGAQHDVRDVAQADELRRPPGA